LNIQKSSTGNKGFTSAVKKSEQTTIRLSGKQLIAGVPVELKTGEMIWMEVNPD
jgi:hypothetical protein